MVGHVPRLVAGDGLHCHEVVSFLPLGDEFHGFLAGDAVVDAPAVPLGFGGKGCVIYEVAEAHVLEVLTLAHVAHPSGIDVCRPVAFTFQGAGDGGECRMEFSLPHEADVGVAQPSAVGRHCSPVRPKGVAVEVLPEDAFGDETAPSGCYAGQSSELLDEAAAEAFNEDYQNVGALRKEQRVLYVVGRLRVESAEEVFAVRLGKEVIALGIVQAEADALGEGIDGIDGGMVCKHPTRMALAVGIALLHEADSRDEQEGPDDADVAHPEALTATCRKSLGGEQDAGNCGPESQRDEEGDAHQDVCDADAVGGAFGRSGIAEYHHAELEVPVLVHHGIAHDDGCQGQPHDYIVRREPRPDIHPGSAHGEQPHEPGHDEQHGCHHEVVPHEATPAGCGSVGE